MRKKPLGVAVVVAVLVLLASCGTSIPDTLPELEPSESESTVDAEAVEAERAREAAAQCRRQLGGMMRELQEIDSRLNVGLSQAEFSTAVGDAQIAYDRIIWDHVNGACLTDVALPLEGAINRYLRANTQWDDCIWDYDCDLDSIDPKLQLKWLAASRQINRAEQGLRRIANSDSGSGI